MPGEAFRDRTIEVTERSEEPVVAKEARLKEEVVVRKEADQSTRQVGETVRRTEVEVEDERGKTRGPTTTNNSSGLASSAHQPSASVQSPCVAAGSESSIDNAFSTR